MGEKGAWLAAWKWKSHSHVWLFATHGLYSPWHSPGQNTGVGSLSLLQEIFPTQGLNQVSCTAGGFFTSWATKGNKSLSQWEGWDKKVFRVNYLIGIWPGSGGHPIDRGALKASLWGCKELDMPEQQHTHFKVWWMDL